MAKTDPYSDAIEAASEEIRGLLKERNRIDTRIKRLTESRATLLRLVIGDAPGNVIGMGLADAIRWSLRNSHPKPRTSGTVTAGLAAAGYDFSAYKNKQASVNGTLQRLVDSGELLKMKFRTKDGTFAITYRLKDDPPAPSSQANTEDKK